MVRCPHSGIKVFNKKVRQSDKMIKLSPKFSVENWSSNKNQPNKQTKTYDILHFVLGHCIMWLNVLGEKSKECPKCEDPSTDLSVHGSSRNLRHSLQTYPFSLLGFPRGRVCRTEPSVDLPIHRPPVSSEAWDLPYHGGGILPSRRKHKSVQVSNGNANLRKIARRGG